MVPIIKSINYVIKCPYLNGTFVLHPETASRNRFSTVSFSFTVHRPLHILTLRIAAAIPRRGTQLYPIYNTTLSFCDFLSHPEKYRLVKIVYNEVRRYGSVPNRCPINPATYAYNNITLKQIDFPSFLPESEYVLDMSGLFGTKMEHCVEIRVNGTLKKFNTS
ncbi:uncharacterized protein LOC125958137 [Anopheles darlingi]|uniref:uncharacterized protein LOC125958137 n=1 Tax=Anopheles darlingi TaxID=43151 RepID=UPI0021000911|nr:uncharacterized protein LOC125958137 [Anopheles darlingi]